MAQSDGKQSSYTNIAHALDLMIEHKTLDLSNIDVAGTVSRHYKLKILWLFAVHNRYRIVWCEVDSSDPASSQIVFLTANDVVMQIDSSSRNKPVTINGDPASQAVSGLVSIRSHDDDDYDDHDDDDDDDHGGGTGTGTGGGEIPVDSSEIIQLVPALNGVQAYKVYKPTAYVSPTSSDICNSQGANGVFLTSLNGSNNNNVGVKAFAIDTYSSRSGGTLPPIPKPNPAVPPKSSESCINDNFAAVVPLLQSGSLLAIKIPEARYTHSKNSNC